MKKSQRLIIMFALTILLTGTLVSQKANAEKFRIEFSGTFSECYGLLCDDHAIGVLVEQPFHGIIEISGTDGFEAVDVDFPYIAARRIYSTKDESFITLNTGTSEYDLFEKMPVSILVNNCDEPACPFIEDYVTFFATKGAFEYFFTLAAPNPPFDSAALPQLAELQSLTASMEILTDDYSVGVFSNNSVNYDLFEELKGLDDNFLLEVVVPVLSTLKK